MDAVTNYRSFIRGTRSLSTEALKGLATDINIDIWQQQLRLKTCADPPMKCYLRFTLAMLNLMRGHVRSQLLLNDMTQSWMTADIEQDVGAGIVIDEESDESFSW